MNINDYESKPMSPELKDTINMPISIPIWGVLVMIGSLLYFGGISMQKLNTLLENFAKMEGRVTIIQEKQTDNLSDMKVMQKDISQLQVRMVAVELSKARK